MLIIIRNFNESFTYLRIGENLNLPELVSREEFLDSIDEVNADEEEYNFITCQMAHIPYVIGRKRGTWHGDFAKFIVANWRI